MTGMQQNPTLARHRKGRIGGTGIVLVAVVVAGGLAAWGILDRQQAVAALGKRAEDASVPRVEVVLPAAGPKTRTLTLPGNINAWYQAPIYAQISGYVKMWYKDYGATVKAGDLLATIESPTIDAELAAAQASLKVAQARYQLAQVTARRYQALAGTQAVSQQDIDVQTANATAEKSQVAAAEQTVARYQAQSDFKRIVAPFDGVVTARRTDVGDYVNAAGGDVSSRGAASELFSVADIHALRIFVSVPQDYSDILKPGLTATLTLPQNPAEKVTAQFMTNANAVNTATRTVVTEFTVDNSKHELLPGAYTSVSLTAPTNPNLFVVPAQALLFRAQGMQVALVDAQSRVHLQSITLGHMLGLTVQVLSGLKKTDRVINNPSIALLEGEAVKVVTPVKGYDPNQTTTATGQPPPGGSDEADAGARR